MGHVLFFVHGLFLQRNIATPNVPLESLGPKVCNLHTGNLILVGGKSLWLIFANADFDPKKKCSNERATCKNPLKTHANEVKTPEMLF